MIKTSLIISTYNWPEALTSCLKSIVQQKLLPDEVLIADDGSEKRTAEIIAAFKKQVSFPVKHIWQPDEGFRLAAIRNKTIAAATGEYIIQVDGDMILHPYFIKDHVAFAKSGTFVRASRIYLDSNLSEKLLRSGSVDINLINKGVSNKSSAFHLPLIWPMFETKYKNKGNERYEIHGCNMAFWREDAIQVNGYNEDFSGWGPEDKEFIVRLLNIGLKKRFIKMGAIAFHLFHLERVRDSLAANEQLLKQAIQSHATNCKVGINQYTKN